MEKPKKFGERNLWHLWGGAYDSTMAAGCFFFLLASSLSDVEHYVFFFFKIWLGGIPKPQFLSWSYLF